MRVIVCQRGARHRYAVPRILEEGGILEALYTDSCEKSILGRLTNFLPFKWGALGRLAGRKVTGISEKRFKASDRIAFQTLMGRQLDFSEDCIRWGLRDADWVYSMFGSELGFLRHAKSSGLKIAVDVIINPLCYRIVANEVSRVGPWGRGSHSTGEQQNIMEGYMREVFSLSDSLLCPCKSVVDGLCEFMPSVAGRAVVLPYGSSLSLVESPSSPVPGRVLFVGTDPVRKGMHYFAEAAALVRQELPNSEFVVAGMSSDDVIGMPFAEELTFLGRLPMNLIHEEFARAQVFCLPSLAEGQAGVVLEALAAGCPVVATREAGVDLCHGYNGMLVSSRDANGLGNCLRQVIQDVELRERLVKNGRNLASEVYSEQAWKWRLLEFFRSAAERS